ncbi:MAG: hypothetical protein F6K22_38455, partial [Okeania sp. SIO2F4]|uniref:hypothetical protein n=1 Tax=Okeania sp. SIO2F4 TaxID=2607790 RepID=UPI001429A825
MTDSIEINSLTGREILGGKLDNQGKNGSSDITIDGKDYGEYAEKLRKACKQLSQLIAWMWIDDDEFPDSLNPYFAIYLKKLFDAILRYQQFCNNKKGNKAITEILLGDNKRAAKTLKKAYADNNQHWDLEAPEGFNLTLQQVYEALVPTDSKRHDHNDNEYVFNKEFTNDYYAEVSIDTYDGTVFYDFFGTNNPTEEPKFIAV